jgi:hypothetical protein
VTNDDPEMFAVIAHVTDALVKWRLRLSWSCNGREGVAAIDIDGEPFLTAGLPGDR